MKTHRFGFEIQISSQNSLEKPPTEFLRSGKGNRKKNTKSKIPGKEEKLVTQARVAHEIGIAK